MLDVRAILWLENYLQVLWVLLVKTLKDLNMTWTDGEGSTVVKEGGQHCNLHTLQIECVRPARNVEESAKMALEKNIVVSYGKTADEKGEETWQSTILVVSHDRNFLNAVATDIVHLHSQRLETYRGDYENFVKTKEERLKNQQREYEAQQQYREHIQ
eukprot:g46090.t1